MAQGRNQYRADWCSRCQAELTPGQKLCSCGKATGYMSFAERAEHEVKQWRAHKSGH